jgi:hypothetical protein
MFLKYLSHWFIIYFIFWFLGYIFNINIIIKYVNPYYTNILLLLGYIIVQLYNIYIKKYEYEYSFLFMKIIKHIVPFILSYYLIKNKHKYAFINMIVVILSYIIYVNYIDENLYKTYFVNKPQLNWDEYINSCKSGEKSLLDCLFF